MQHLEIGYNDILNMPTNERRFYLGLLVKKRSEERERIEEGQTSSSSKGTRKTKISGDSLKNKIKTGNIPIT